MGKSSFCEDIQRDDITGAYGEEQSREGVHLDREVARPETLQTGDSRHGQQIGPDHLAILVRRQSFSES